MLSEHFSAKLQNMIGFDEIKRPLNGGEVTANNCAEFVPFVISHRFNRKTAVIIKIKRKNQIKVNRYKMQMVFCLKLFVFVKKVFHIKKNRRKQRKRKHRSDESRHGNVEQRFAGDERKKPVTGKSPSQQKQRQHIVGERVVFVFQQKINAQNSL